MKSDISASAFSRAKRIIWVDLGYLGIKNWLPHQLILILYKRPRKSIANPSPKLTIFQKEYNRFVGSNRVLVENALAGLKRYAILANKFRNKQLEFADEMVNLAAGLWNFKLIKKS